MNDLTANLFEAHVEHELNAFRNGGYKKTIEAEAAGIFNWLKDIKLKEIITPEKIIGLIKRAVVENPVAGGITELVGEMSRKVLESDHNKNTVLEDIFARKQFDDILDKGVALENARIYLIKRFLHSSAYSKLLSNILYTGIKEYLLSEKNIAQQLPVISSLIKIGKKASAVAEHLPVVSTLVKSGKNSFNSIMPSLGSDIENRVKQYIETNIDNNIQHSENFLIDIFNEKHILEMGYKIWDSISKTPLSEYFNTINTNDMEDFIIIQYDFWIHFRKTRYFEEIYKELVYYFFDKYGDNELDLIMEDVGISESLIINEVIELLSPGVEKALEDGYLEERIRTRLESFYCSEKASSLLAVNDQI